MLKQLLPYVVLLLVAALIFVSGYYAGSKHVNAINSTYTAREIYDGCLHSITILNYLDKGEVETARQFLISEQDTNIFMIDSLVSSEDKTSFDTTCRMFDKINKHRNDFRVKYYDYNCKPTNESSELRTKVEGILSKWSATSCSPK